VRLASPLTPNWDSPEGWVDALRRHGFRTAFWPLDEHADEATEDAYGRAADAAGIVVAETGAWSNPISPDPRIRAAALELCKRQLALADRIGARCCVTTAGTHGDTTYGPHPDNLSRDTFALIVDTVREIVDAVNPQRTAFTLEPMPWTWPDSPDSYLELLEAVDRPGFAVHLDPVNMINTPAKYYDNAGFLRECFAKLGRTSELSCEGHHARGRADRPPGGGAPGLGQLDFRVLLTELDRLDPDTPILVEHLTQDEEYRAAVAHVREVADSLGLAV